MENKASRYFLIGYGGWLLSVIVCIFLLPQSLVANGGISYFSAHKTTVIPYSIGVFLLALFSYKVAQNLPRKSQKVMRAGFKTFSVMLIAVVAIPYGINFTFEYVHTLLSAALFRFQFIVVWWLAFKVRWDGISLLLLVLLAAEMVATVMYLGPRKGYLLEGELVFQLTFATAAYRTIKHITGKKALKNEV
jgi:hypothetical protein